jgi:hypothetical protein
LNTLVLRKNELHSLLRQERVKSKTTQVLLTAEKARERTLTYHTIR